jgi:hypothetical protein
MSYLPQFATRRPLPKGVRGVRIDGAHAPQPSASIGDAFVRVFVEDTTLRKWRRRPPEPRVRLRIGDCVNEINLEFSLESAVLRENSLYKVDTLLDALARFRSALDAEAELYAKRNGQAAETWRFRQPMRWRS